MDRAPENCIMKTFSYTRYTLYYLDKNGKSLYLREVCLKNKHSETKIKRFINRKIRDGLYPCSAFVYKYAEESGTYIMDIKEFVRNAICVL